jgi:hypothetical protein
MDARITRDTHTWNLINIETNAIEAENLGTIAAKDLQNVLWSRGTKTRLVVHVAYTDAEYAAHNRAFCGGC